MVFRIASLLAPSLLALNLSLSGQEGGESQPTPGLSIGAYYYPWYRAAEAGETGWMSQALRGRLKPQQLPKLGVYGSRDPEVIGGHISQSVRAGLDFWAVSWWGPDRREDRALREHILTHADAGKLKYALLYESTGRLGSIRAPNYDKLLGDFAYMKEHYFDHPLYLDILREEKVAAEAAVGKAMPQGKPVDLKGVTATLTKIDSLPFVESRYTQRFKFDTFDNPKLKALRERYSLDEVMAPGKDEFDRQVHLMDWTHRQFKKFGRPSKQVSGALEILQAIGEGHRFFCTQYGQVFVSAAASLGWVDRVLALRRHQGVNQRGGSTEHTTTEIWSNQFGKWVMLDPTSNLYLEKDGVPLNAWEIRQEWFYRDGKDLVFVIGKERKRFRKADLPIFLGSFEGFGDLTVDPDELDKYGFIGYIPNNDLMNSGFDYGKMFIVRDELCAGTNWHTRDLPENPAADPYFPIGQAALSVVANEEEVHVELRTLTPNFLRFEVKMDGGEWTPSGDRLNWDLHDGLNRLEARTVNLWHVAGPVSTAVVHVTNR